MSLKNWLSNAWLLLGPLGIGWAYLATSAYGAGVNGDSVRYLSAAQNLLAGLGLVDYSLEPLLTWPPLFSALLAGLSLIFGDVFLIGWGLNIFLYGLNIVLFGWLAKKLMPSFTAAPFLASLIMLAAPSILRMHTSIVSDPLFLTSTLIVFLLTIELFKEFKNSTFAWLLLFSGIAGLIKYPGAALGFTASAVLFLFWLKNEPFLKTSLRTISLILITIFPLGLWIYFHNYLQHGSFFGLRKGSGGLDNIFILVEKALYWFMPYSFQKPFGAYGLLAIIIFIAFLIIQPTNWKPYFKRLLSGPFLAVSLFFAIYCAMMVFLVSYSEHKDFQVDRLHIQLFPPLVIFLLALLENAKLRFEIKLPFSRNMFISLIILAWLIYPSLNAIKYVQASLINGETSNNIYNTRAMNETDIIAYLRENPFAPNSVIYSNHEGAAWFFTRQNSLSMPQGPVDLDNEYDLNQVLSEYSNWPPNAGYVVWFDLPFKLHVVKPNELTSLVSLKPLFSGESGQTYEIEPK